MADNAGRSRVPAAVPSFAAIAVSQPLHDRSHAGAVCAVEFRAHVRLLRPLSKLISLRFLTFTVLLAPFNSPVQVGLIEQHYRRRIPLSTIGAVARQVARSGKSVNVNWI